MLRSMKRQSGQAVVVGILCGVLLIRYAQEIMLPYSQAEPLPHLAPVLANAPSSPIAPSRPSTGGDSKEAIVVGLNRAVYRLEDERQYACPRLGRSCVFTTLKERFREADAIIDVVKDPRKTKPLDFGVRKGQLKGVIISEQDKAKKSSSVFKRNKYDFEIGYNKADATVWRPFMCNELSRKTNVIPQP